MTDKTPSIAERDAVAIDKARIEFERLCGMSAAAWITGNADAVETMNLILSDFNTLQRRVKAIREES